MNGNVETSITAFLTGEAWTAKDTTGTRPTQSQVSELAYHLYETRGRQDGHAVEDWLLAEERLANGDVAWSRGDAMSTSRDGERT